MAQIILDSNNNLIQGDFDNATLNNRTKLQTTTTNATTNVYVAPNGSSTSAGVSVANNSSLTNASKIVMATNGTTDTQIISGINGSGTYLPMSFYVNNTLALQISTAGVVTAPYGGFSGAGGMTLLGTLTTTSGSTQTLSGLTLTGYKALFFSFNAVSCTGAGQITINTSYVISAYLASAGETATGTGWLDLSNGVASGSIPSQSYPYVGASVTNMTTASTSISFNSPAATTFDAGSIKVYGVS